MNTERDELADVLQQFALTHDRDDSATWGDYADNLIAAGYRKLSDRCRPTAAEEAMRRYSGDVDSETGACVDDWGYSEGERRAFIAGALFESHSKQPTINTVAELDALPVGAIVLDGEGEVARKLTYGWRVLVSESGFDAWLSDSLEETYLPATVLHTPEGEN